MLPRGPIGPALAKRLHEHFGETAVLTIRTSDSCRSVKFLGAFWNARLKSD
jgi:hypothetical protein